MAPKADAAVRNISTLVRVIVRIERLDPLLGDKWKANMLKYYYARLAEKLADETPSGSDPRRRVEEVLKDIQAKVADPSFEA